MEKNYKGRDIMITTSQIRIIHTLKSQLGLDDEIYKDILHSFDASSCKQLSEAEARIVIQNLQEKLDTLTSYQHKNIKEDINEMICKYSYAKYGPNNKYAIMLGNKDIYKEFYKRYKVNIESAQLAFIEFVNNKREETGKPKIIWDSANSLIISKIDIIDKLGLLVEYYFVVKEMCNKILL